LISRINLLENSIRRFFLTITPALSVALISYFLGPSVYMPIISIVTSFFFAVGVGWIVSPALGIASGFHPLWIILLLIFISSQSSLIISANYDFLEKIPLLGSVLRKVRKRAGKLIEKHDLGEEVSYLSIFWLMFLPIYGSGPMVMSLVGRLLDLDWIRVWTTVTLSALIRFTLITLLIYYSVVTL